MAAMSERGKVHGRCDKGSGQNQGTSAWGTAGRGALAGDGAGDGEQGDPSPGLSLLVRTVFLGEPVLSGL